MKQGALIFDEQTDRYRHEFKEVSEEDIPVHSIPIDELSRENFYNLI